MKPMPFWMWLMQTAILCVLFLAAYWLLYWIGLPVLACALVGLVIAGVLTALCMIPVIDREAKR